MAVGFKTYGHEDKIWNLGPIPSEQLQPRGRWRVAKLLTMLCRRASAGAKLTGPAPTAGGGRSTRGGEAEGVAAKEGGGAQGEPEVAG